jgi:hypothetical protein
VTLVERGAPHSLPLMESGKLLPGVGLIIADPETRGQCGDSNLGEVKKLRVLHGPNIYKAVLRIHDILGWIRILGSMPLSNGSGFGSGSWIRILLFSSLTFKMPAKNYFFNTIFSAYYFLKLHLHHFSKIKSKKESQNRRNQGYCNYFCMMIDGSGSGSGSRRPKNMWIRIRIRNTAIKAQNP